MSDSNPASDTLPVMLFTQLASTCEALSSTLPPPVDRGFTPSSTSEAGTEDTDHARTKRRSPRSRSSSPLSLASIAASAGANSPAGRRCARQERFVGRRSFQRRFCVDPYMISPRVPRRRSRPRSALELLLDLDSPSGVGLSPTQFKKLFSRCDDCSRIMTKRSFVDHVCLGQDVPHTLIEREIDVVDLTEDD